MGQPLGGRDGAGEGRLVVEVAVVDVGKDGVQLAGGGADVDDDAVGVELGPPELDVDDVGGAVQALRRAEHLAAQAVGDHHVVAHADGEHRLAPLDQ